MIQTGHSNGQATDDEQKILANLIFSLYQISSNTSTIDRSAMDYGKPTTPEINVSQTDANNINITFSSSDVGTDYTYKVEAYDKLNYDVPIATSNTPTTTVMSGFDKYYYLLDDQENNDFEIGTATENNNGSINGTYQQFGKKYLHVKAVDKAGNVSDVKTVKIVDQIAPEIEATPTESTWSNSANIQLNFTDEGGSGFRGYQYVVTDNQQEDSPSWNQETAGASGNVTINEEGTKYLHVKVFDNDGNSKEKTFGPYKVDHTNPTVQIDADLQNITTEPIAITIRSQDPLSGIKEVYLDDQKLEGLEEATTTVSKNGTYTIKVRDVAGNEYTEQIKVTNIYQHCDKNLEHPDFTTDIDSCPICDLIEGIEVTNESVVYNAKEQGISYTNPHNATLVEYYGGLAQKPIAVGDYQYELKVTYNGVDYKTGVSGTFKITKKAITIEGVSGKNRAYNGNTTVELQGGNLVGIEFKDEGKVKFNLPATGEADGKNIGEHNVQITTITLTGEESGNYELTQPTPNQIKVTIGKKQITIQEIKAKDRQYNGDTTVQIEGGKLIGVEDIDNGQVQIVLPKEGTISSKNIGQYDVQIPTITLEGQEATNYELTQPIPEEVKVTAIGDNIIPAKINLGTTEDVTIKGNNATPKIWVTELDSKEAINQGIQPNGEVSLTDNEEYYMIYSLKVKIKVPDESGELQDKDIELEIKPNGEKNKTEEDGGLGLSKDPNKPEGWTDPDSNTQFEGWIKGEENKDNPDTPIIDPETEIPQEGDEYLPKFTKTIKVERYVN